MNNAKNTIYNPNNSKQLVATTAQTIGNLDWLNEYIGDLKSYLIRAYTKAVGLNSKYASKEQTTKSSRPIDLLWSLNGLLMLAGIIAITLAAPLLTIHDPLDMVGIPLTRPGLDPDHWLGTDSLGRDVFAGLIYGARASLYIGIGAALISLSIGITVGLCAGYYGGITERVLVSIIELFQTIPAFLLAIVLVTIYRPSLNTILFAIGIASWPEIARLSRAECKRIKALEFIQAAYCSGFSKWHIMLREILPNALPSLIVSSSILIAHAILMESGLAFLGLSDPNIISWGGMISIGREQLSSAWYLTAVPGAAIAITVLAFNHLGDQLNDYLNPRQQRLA